MYKHRQSKVTKTSLKINNSYVGETLETKLSRAKQSGENMDEGSPIIYSERKDGVLPQYNIRTDKMELALDAMDIHSRNKLAKREERLKKEDDAAKERLKAQADAEGGGTPVNTSDRPK